MKIVKYWIDFLNDNGMYVANESEHLDKTLMILASEFSRDAILEGRPGEKFIDQVHQSIYYALGIHAETNYEIEGRTLYTTPVGQGKAVMELFAYGFYTRWVIF